MPVVSVGVPVYNGERFLAETLESLLAQTFQDFEIIICDNASTDKTRDISLHFSRRDPRVRYFRYDEHVGAAPNFNRAFERATGVYFKWAACDDLCAPQFLRRCADVLDADPGTVLAYSRVTVIDSDSNEVAPYTLKLPTDSADPVRRFGAIMAGHKCYEVFGLIRRDALARTPLMGGYSHGDGVLLARLALQGKFEEISENLFFTRRHLGQSAIMEAESHRRQYAVWFDSRLKGKILFPHWRTLFEYWRSIHRAPLRPVERIRCYRWAGSRTYAARRYLKADVTYHLKALVRRFLPKSVRLGRGDGP